MKKTVLFASLLFVPVLSNAKSVNSLNNQNVNVSPWQVPLADANLPSVSAQLWKNITKTPTALEGPVFDIKGNLYFTDVYNGRVIEITPEKRMTVIYEENGFAPCSIQITEKGQLIIAGIYLNGKGGLIFSVNKDGSDKRIIVPVEKGYLPNDMIFDSHHGLYFTDARGNSGEPSGGVYYVSPDSNDVKPVMKNMSGANGIALSPDEKTLWVIDFSAGVLHRIILNGPTGIAPFGETVAYRFNSPAPDSMKVDREGNLYVALNGSGRVVVLNKKAAPVAQILIPGRSNGHFLRTSNMAIKPGTNEIYIMASNDDNLNLGSAIFRVKGLGKAKE